MIIFWVATIVILLWEGVMPARIKEWAYACFTFNFLSASISHWALDGFGIQALFPYILLLILTISYLYYHKINRGAEHSRRLA